MKNLCRILAVVFGTLLLINQETFAISTNLYKVSGTIIDSISNERLPFATISIASKDHSTQYLTTDENGNMVLSLPNGNYFLEISYIGYKRKKTPFAVGNAAVNLGRIAMQQDTFQVQEVVITERRRLIKLTNSGIEYDLSKDLSIQSTNLLYALRNVPLVNVDGNGKITVKGSEDYSIYLNGKPYRIAQSNPKDVLQSIPASTIAKIEVITNPDAKYDGEDGSTIINIVTSHTSFDGYSLTINGAGESQPKGNAGVSFIGGIRKVILSTGYNYSIDAQNEQPIENDQQYYQNGKLMQSVKMRGLGDGQWHNHTFRAMLSLEVDSLNSIYVDGHGLLKSTNHRTEWHETIKKWDENESQSLFSTQNKCQAGTAETNLIYRNLYKKSKRERLTLGYRYTYNPDQRSYLSWATDFDNGMKGKESSKTSSQTHNKNDGGLSEHTILGDMLFEINRKNLLRVGFKQIFRNGNSNPAYYNWDLSSNSWKPTTEQADNMCYTQDVLGMYVSYSTSFKRVNIDVGVRGEYSWMKMNFPHTPDSDFSSNQLEWLPRGSISYLLTNQQQLKFSYSSRIGRPAITLLNPFTNKLSDYFISYGNPFLKNEYNHTLSLNYMTFSNKLTIFGGLDYSLTNRAILGYNKKADDANIMASTYGNIGKVTKAGGNIYINYRPVKNLSLTASYNAAYYGISSVEHKLKQNSLTYNLMLMGSLNLKKAWTLGGHFGLFKQMPQPWGSYDSFSNYSLSIYKGYLNGNLNIGLILNSPFNKYTKLISNIVRDELRQNQINNMTARSIGLNISYTLRSKKQVKLNREKRNQNDDQETGVK